MIYPPFSHPLWLIPVFLLGACVGSFLNVVIYRVPLGMSVNEPKRSFCPGCRKPIPMRRNIPLVSWLWLRGRCADCGSPIAFRYFGVELLTALLFTAVWWWWVSFAGLGAAPRWEALAILPLWVMLSVFVAITFIDAEHMIIPTGLTWGGSAAGVAAALLAPSLADLAAFSHPVPGWKEGLIQSAAGWVLGFFGLWGVVLLGKAAFGKKKMEWAEPVEWRLVEAESEAEEEPIWFEMGDQRMGWWEMFFRKSDRLLIEADSLKVNGEEAEAGTVTVKEDGVELPTGRRIPIEELKALSGTGRRAVIPREAMGMGDVHLMGMIGAFFGGTGVFFTLFASSVFAIAAALLGRVGFGRPLPFGPFLILGALAWMFGGWRLAEWYFGKIGF